MYSAFVLFTDSQRELDFLEESFNTLSAAVEKDPNDPQLLVALATECLYAEQVGGHGLQPVEHCH